MTTSLDLTTLLSLIVQHIYEVKYMNTYSGGDETLEGEENVFEVLSNRGAECGTEFKHKIVRCISRGLNKQMIVSGYKIAEAIISSIAEAQETQGRKEQFEAQTAKVKYHHINSDGSIGEPQEVILQANDTLDVPIQADGRDHVEALETVRKLKSRETEKA